MTEHTPGPWAVFEESDADDRERLTVGLVHPDGGIDEAIMWTYSLNIDAMANARLIAAAPDLLAALETAYRYVHKMSGEDGDVLADAIAKARGE